MESALFNKAKRAIMKKWQPRDVIALVALLIAGALLIMGHNHAITLCFAGIIGAYVGVDIITVRRR